MGRHPKQYLMGEALGVGRGIGHRLIGEDGGLKIDRNPGLELRQPVFRDYFVNAMRQERDFIRRIGMPVALEVSDEPRENPNPWNRNLADSIAYGDLMREAGVVSFITPMGDTESGKDYTVLADHVDIISTHAWKGSAGLIARTRAKGKTLWLYNTGMDRFSWGFYNWRRGRRAAGNGTSAGRTTRPAAATPAASGTTRSPTSTASPRMRRRPTIRAGCCSSRSSLKWPRESTTMRT